MKYTKSILGEIGVLETNANHKDTMKKITKEARALKCWEVCKLKFEDNKSLKDFPIYEYLWCDDGASGLYGFGNKFIADDRGVGSPWKRLRWVCVVKK